MSEFSPALQQPRVITPSSGTRHRLFWICFFLALSLLALNGHIDYLNHLDKGKWGHRYLIVNINNKEFVHRLERLKTLVLIGWVVIFSGFFWHCYMVRKEKGYGFFPQPLIMRSAIASVVLLASLINYNPPDIELSLYFFINTALYALIAICLYRMPGGVRFFTWLGGELKTFALIPTAAYAVIAFLTVCLVGYHLGGPFFEHMPLTVDINAEMVHAKMLLKGKWFYPSEHYREFYNMWMMINDGRWLSQYPPGHLYLMAIATYFERRTLLLPILGGLTTWAVFWFAKELYGRTIARLALVLAGACVYLIVMSSEFMMNGTSLLTATLFYAAYMRMLKKPSIWIGLIGGAAVGYCLITRPYSALGVAAPFVLHAIYLLLSEFRRYWKAVFAMGFMGLCFVGIQLYWNQGTTGDPFVFGYQRAWGDWHNPLTGSANMGLTDYTLEKNFRENLQRLAWFNRIIFEWPLPTLTLVALIYGWRGSRREERLLMLSVLSSMAACQVLPGNVEREWGPRLMYEVLTIFIVLCAKGLYMLPALCRVMLPQRRPVRYYWGLGAALFICMYWFTFSHNATVDTMKWLYNFYYRGSDPGLYRVIKKRVHTPALVFVPWMSYQAVSFSNPPEPDDQITYAIDLGPRNKSLINQHRNRLPYRAYPSRYGGYVVEPIE